MLVENRITAMQVTAVLNKMPQQLKDRELLHFEEADRGCGEPDVKPATAFFDLPQSTYGKYANSDEIENTCFLNNVIYLFATFGELPLTLAKHYGIFTEDYLLNHLGVFFKYELLMKGFTTRETMV